MRRSCCTATAIIVLNYQAFLYEDWPGGMYGSLALAGARPAAPIAAAWAVMNFLGEDGYVRLCKQTIETARRLRQGHSRTPVS